MNGGKSVMKKSGKSIYIAALILFLGGVGYLAYSGFSENSVYFLNVSEALAVPADRLKAARLFGTVAERDFFRSQDGRTVRFNLEDQTTPEVTLHIDFEGAVPDTFKVGVEVIVEGGITSEGDFRATSLMTKCPSKYQKENRS